MLLLDPLAGFLRTLSDQDLHRLLAEADELFRDSVANRDTWPVKDAVRVVVVRDYLRKEKASRERSRS